MRVLDLEVSALHFLDLTIFQVSVVVLLFEALAGYGANFLALSRLAPDGAYLSMPPHL